MNLTHRKVLITGGSAGIGKALLKELISHGVKDLADSFSPYLTLGEGIKLAAINFRKGLSKLIAVPVNIF